MHSRNPLRGPDGLRLFAGQEGVEDRDDSRAFSVLRSSRSIVTQRKKDTAVWWGVCSLLTDSTFVVGYCAKAGSEGRVRGG